MHPLRSQHRAALLMAVCSVTPAVAAAPYAYFTVGDPERPVTASPTQPSASVVLMGGGYDVGEAFRWMIDRAGVTPRTGGRFVIVRASGSDAYNGYVYSELGTVDGTTPRRYENVGGRDLGLTSVETLIVPSRHAAADPFVLRTLSRASAIWIAGGDQADYFRFWKATPLEEALREAVARGVPVGGTSAGTAMLGQYAFVALEGSVSSAQALADPFDRRMSIDPVNTSSKRFPDPDAFLSNHPLAGVVTDQHLNTRDRLGRLVAFVARIGSACPGAAQPLDGVRGIGLDEETALLIGQDADGGFTARLAVNPVDPANFEGTSYFPSNAVYLVRITGAEARCEPGQALRIGRGGIAISRMYDAEPRAGSGPGSMPRSSYATGTVLRLGDWKDGKGHGTGAGISGPAYYGADEGELRFGPRPF